MYEHVLRDFQHLERVKGPGRHILAAAFAKITSLSRFKDFYAVVDALKLTRNPPVDCWTIFPTIIGDQIRRSLDWRNA